MADADAGDAVGMYTDVRDVPSARTHQKCAPLADGRVYICGGGVSGASGNTDSVSAAHIYDPVDDSYIKVRDLPSGLFGHTCAPLPDGRVYICGGIDALGVCADARIYNPVEDSYIKVRDLPSAHTFQTCAPLADGRVYICGGMPGGASKGVTDAHIYNPVDDSYTKVRDLPTPRVLHTCAPLADGRVYICGGGDKSGVSADARIYNPVDDSYIKVRDLPSTRALHTCAPLADGRVYICGGVSGAHIYNPVDDSYIKVRDLPSTRAHYTCAPLADGRVYICGGDDTGDDPVASMYIYTPLTELPPKPILEGSFRVKTEALETWLAKAELLLCETERQIGTSRTNVQRRCDDRVAQAQAQFDRSEHTAERVQIEAVRRSERARVEAVQRADRAHAEAVQRAATTRGSANLEFLSARNRALREANQARDGAMGHFPVAKLADLESKVKTVRVEADEYRQMAAMLEGHGAPAPPGHECVVCTDKDATHLVVPCGHKCLCVDCSGILVARGDPCPICRGVIGSMVKVF